MIKEIDNPASVDFFINRLIKQKEVLRIVDSGAIPMNYYEGIPLDKLRHGIVFSIYSDFQQIRDMGHQSLARDLVKK